MQTIETSVDIRVPAEDAYREWCDLEQLPELLPNIEEIEELDSGHSQWTASVAGKTEEWTAEISERMPGKRIAWHATAGRTNAGCVTFHRLSDDQSRLMLQLEFPEKNLVEKVGNWLGVVEASVQRNLDHFKTHVEARHRDREDATPEDRPSRPESDVGPNREFDRIH